MNQFNNIFKDLKRHSLSENERISMRNNLLSHMAENPPKAPFSLRLSDFLDGIADAFGSQQRSGMRFVPAALALCLVVGVGTAYAAEGALPGEALYGVKLNVNESLKGALAVSDSAKTSWNTQRLERRLQEAEVLVASGTLTPVAQAQIETQIEKTVRAFDKSVARLAISTDEATVAAAQSDLEASLIGHAEVLVALTNSDDDSKMAAQPIVASVLARAEKVQAARAGSEASVAAKRDGKDVREAALAKKQLASQAVSMVRAKASANKVQATTSAEVAEQSALMAEQVITHAEQKLKEGDYGSAFTVFQEAIRTVQTASVHLDASERLNTDVRVFSRNRDEGTAAATLMMDAANTTTVEEGGGN